MPSVSIIVACYKVEKYLRGCLDSLMKQTSDDYQIVVVNDESPDGVQNIIDEYVSRYPEKIKGYRNGVNKGYGGVLNLAIRECGTPYFLICDADDTIRENTVELLLNSAKISGADITIGAKYFVYEGSDDKDYHASYNTEFVKLKTNTVYHRENSDFNDLFFVDPSPHSKLYRTELAKDLVFPEHVGYTDNLLYYTSLLKSSKVVYMDDPFAYYLVNRAGNTMTDVRVGALKGQINVFKRIVDEAEQMINVPDIFYFRMFESFKFLLYQTRRLNASEQEYSEVMDELQTFLEKLLPYGKAVKSFYGKYEKTGAVEKIRDYGMLTQVFSKAAYADLKNKMIKEFKAKA